MEPFFANFDLASLAIWGFWVFFAGLIVYLQTENMREGYPLQNDDGEPAANQGPFPVPRPKTFVRPNGLDDVTVPTLQPEDRKLKLAKTAVSEGFPFEPTGDPMVDGVGPAAWANRADRPELDAHGNPKIVPMSKAKGFRVSAGIDPRGLPVVSGDRKIVGTLSDIWIDEGEQLPRYLEFEMEDGGSRLVPTTLVVIKQDRVVIRSLYADQFANIPKHKSARQVTLLEEDKISAYYCGGNLYAGNRQTPLV
ncbi:MAG: photosynthetic reaction center subunit H [Pseudomonadota bacterium]